MTFYMKVQSLYWSGKSWQSWKNKDIFKKSRKTWKKLGRETGKSGRRQGILVCDTWCFYFRILMYFICNASYDLSAIISSLFQEINCKKWMNLEKMNEKINLAEDKNSENKIFVLGQVTLYLMQKLSVVCTFLLCFVSDSLL